MEKQALQIREGRDKGERWARQSHYGMGRACVRGYRILCERAKSLNLPSVHLVEKKAVSFSVSLVISSSQGDNEETNLVGFEKRAEDAWQSALSDL